LRQGIVRFRPALVPKKGKTQQAAVVGREVIPARSGKGGQSFQHGVSLVFIKGNVLGVLTLHLQKQGNFQAAARGVLLDQFFQHRFKGSGLSGKTPAHIQMPTVDAADFPNLGPMFFFQKAAAKAGHAAQHTNSPEYAGSG
jgi:hypothetical protein